MPINPEKIDQNGWRQGSVFELTDSARLLAEHIDRPELPGVDLGPEARLILASHSCEIVHPRDQEPFVEVVPAKPLAANASVGDAGHGRIARRLRIPIRIGGTELVHELHAPLRFRVARERLQELEPDPNAVLSREALRDFTFWLTLRYRRRVFPAAFDRRLGEGHKKIRKLLRPIEALYVAFLYSLNTERELPPGESYRLRIVLIVCEFKLTDDGTRQACDEAVDALEGLFDAADGIELDDISLRSDTQFSLAEYVSFESWGFEELSLESNLPPAAL